MSDYHAAKEQMLRRHLKGRGIRDVRVLEAMAQVPREAFLPADIRDQAYTDRALPIGCEQTISQPYIVALMTEALALKGTERVLEIGTGSGYQTAVLGELVAEVVSIERHAELSRRAGELLASLGYTNLMLATGDGTLGWPARAPYDRIIVTAAAAGYPPPLVEQLAEGGLCVIPIGERDHQRLEVATKHGDRLQRVTLSSCRFVPLVGEAGAMQSEEGI